MDTKTLFSGMAFAFSAYAAYAFSDGFARLLSGSINPFEVAFLGGVFGFFLLPFIRNPKESYIRIIRPEVPKFWYLRAICIFISTASSVEAFMLLPMPEALSITFLTPLFVTIASVLFIKEKVTLWAWLAIILGFIGVLVVLRPGIKPINIGHVCAFIVALANTGSIIFFRLSTKEKSKLSLLGSNLVGAIVGNGILMLPHLQLPKTPEIWFFLFGYGFLTALGQLFMIIATSRAPANRVALPQYSQMVWGVGLSYIVFKEPLDRFTFIGITILTFSGLLNWFRQRIRYEKMARKERLSAAK